MYFDFFSRMRLSETEFGEYRRAIAEPLGERSVKWNALFAESFAHHVSPHIGPSQRELVLLKNDHERWIAKDDLTSHFIHDYYIPPLALQYDQDEDPDAEDDSSNASPKDQSEEEYDGSLAKFAARVSQFPITNELENGFRAGSNRTTFLLGDIGQGKSVFATKLYSYFRTLMYADLRTRHDSSESDQWILIPIYFDIGSSYLDSKNGAISDIGDELFEKLFRLVAQSVTRKVRFLDEIAEYDQFTAHNISAKSDLIELIAHLVSRRIRLFLIFDNLDQYHFQYKKYAFMEMYSVQQDASVRGNIGGLVHSFENELENPGLCVLLICRKYVYEHLRVISDVLSPIRDSASVYELSKVATQDVVESRQRLYSNAEQKINLSHPDPKVRLEMLRAMINEADSTASDDEPSKPVFRMLKLLGHHGHRGMVEFLCELKVHDEIGDVYRRLFEHQQILLLILYINNQKRRYTQANEHFPNIFLNDLVVSHDPTFPTGKAPHMHTYWLKYLILKFVVSRGRVNSEEVIRLFTDKGGYEATLVKVVLGSLTTSEFHCIHIDLEGSAEGSNRWLKPTDRGKSLVSVNFGLTPTSSEIEFCFSFVYLQLMVEDWMLALPKSLVESMKPNGDYSYIYYRDTSYGVRANLVIRNRAKATLWFLKILVSSFEVERLNRPRMSAEFRELGPNLSSVKHSLFNEISRIGHAISGGEVLNDLSGEIASYDADIEDLKAFFEDYYRSGCCVEA